MASSNRFQCHATSTGGNDSMAAHGNYACLKLFFVHRKIGSYLFARIIFTKNEQVNYYYF